MGMQSPAEGLLHELLGHGLDINMPANLLAEIGPQWQNGAEHLAVNIESAFGIVFGEPLRDNHGGQLMWVDDVTTHTTMGEDGELILTRMGADGKDKYGPQIDYTSPGWKHLDGAFKIIIQASVVQQNSNVSADDLLAALKIVATQTGGTVVYDEHNNPYIFHNPEVPGPDTPIIVLDPQNGAGGTSNGNTGGGAWESGWGSWDTGGSGSGSGGGSGGDDSGAWESGWPGSDDDSGSSGGGGGGDAGCVAVTSFLPDGRRAGDITVGDSMELADQHTLERDSGRVSYSQEKFASGYRIVTESGATLACSDTAPIAVKAHGLMTPDRLLGEQIAVRWDENGTTTVGWEKVVAVEQIGLIKVQHITVSNKCFWAGEKKGAYILHHNMKMAGGGSGNGGDGNDDWWFFDDKADITRAPSDGPATPHHVDPSGAHLVGVPPAIDGGIFT